MKRTICALGNVCLGFVSVHLPACADFAATSPHPSSADTAANPWAGAGGSSDAGTTSWSSTRPDAATASDTGPAPPGNSNVNLGGAQDFGFVRALLANGQIPTVEQLDAAGFFAEHHTPLPDPVCGKNLCLQAMLGVMANLIDGNTCTLLQVGLNSPLVVDPDNRPPLSLAVVVDVSGSMSGGDKIGFTRDGLAKLVNALHDDDMLAIITYNEKAKLAWAMQPVFGNRNKLQTLIAGIQDGGSTNLHDGLELGFQEVMGVYDSGRQNRVILLSDGMPTAGIADTDSILEMSEGYNSDGIGLTTVGLGTDFNLVLMRGLAEQADGNFYFVENAAAVDEVFDEEVSYFTVPVGFDVKISVAAGSDYTFQNAYGSRLFDANAEGGSLEVPSVFLAHRLSHDDIVDNPDGTTGRRGGGSALLLEMMPKHGLVGLSSGYVADVQLQWREPGTNDIIHENLSIEYPYSPSDILAVGFFDNAIVTKSFVMLNIFVAMQFASQAFHAGRLDESVSVLSRIIAAAQDFEDSANDGEGDIDIELDIELLQDFLAVVETHYPVDEAPAEPEIPADPWPAD